MPTTVKDAFLAMLKRTKLYFEQDGKTVDVSKAMNKPIEAVVERFKGGSVELRWFPGRDWHAHVMPRATDVGEMAKKSLAEQGFTSVTLDQMNAERQRLAERAIASGQGKTIFEALANIRART